MYTYKCKVLRVVDGDTCDAFIDLGFNTWIKKRIRFYGVDTWECRTRNLEEKKKGLEAKQYVQDLFDENNSEFILKSHGVGKFGRVLGELFINTHDKSINELLKENGHAYEYYGGTKRTISEKKEV